MTLISKINSAINESRNASDFFLNEDKGFVTIGATMSRKELSSWQRVYESLEDWLTFRIKDDFGEVASPDDGSEGECYTVTMQIASASGSAYIFSREGWLALLHDETQLNSVTSVCLAFETHSFDALSFSVKPWLFAPAPGVAVSKSSKANSPKRFVRFLSPKFCPPTNIEPWLLKGVVPDGSVAFSDWARIASDMIIRSLPNELEDNGERSVVLNGQPLRRIALGCSSEVDFGLLQEVANWVYIEGEDIEVRHTFFSSELSREWPQGVDFRSGLSARLLNSLESAKLLYKAHLRSGSKDTLKSLAELRKALADEMQRVHQQARDISAAVWRDVMIIIGIIGIRLASDAVRADQDVATHFYFLYLFLALYILTSFRMAASTNKDFLAVIEKARVEWRKKLYAYLDNEDYSRLAEEPISDSIKNYKSAERSARSVVLLVSVMLILKASWELFI